LHLSAHATPLQSAPHVSSAPPTTPQSLAHCAPLHSAIAGEQHTQNLAHEDGSRGALSSACVRARVLCARVCVLCARVCVCVRAYVCACGGWDGIPTLTAETPCAPLRARNPLAGIAALLSDAVLGTVGTGAGFAARFPGARLGAVDPSATCTALLSAGGQNAGVVKREISGGAASNTRLRHGKTDRVKGVACGSTGLGTAEPDTVCNCRRTVHPNLAHGGGGRRFRNGCRGRGDDAVREPQPQGSAGESVYGRAVRGRAYVERQICGCFIWDLPVPHAFPRHFSAQLALTHGTSAAGIGPPAAQRNPQHVTASGVPTTHPASAGEQDSTVHTRLAREGLFRGRRRIRMRAVGGREGDADWVTRRRERLRSCHA
jgi:hypothetical protein